VLILQGGVPKSGNLWLYKIIQGICKRAGIERRCFIQSHAIYPEALTWELSHADQANVDSLDIGPDGCFFRVSDVFREKIEDIDDYLGQCSHVWTHSSICDRSFDVLPKFDKIIYIIRDPRDVAISMSRYVFTPHVRRNHPAHYEKDPDSFLAHGLDGLLREWVQHVGAHLKHLSELNIYIVFYERLLASFDSELMGILDDLGLSLSEQDRREIQAEVSFAEMRAKDPGHVRKGQSTGWVTTLTDKQKCMADRIVGRMLSLLNYSLGDEGQAKLPGLPNSIDPAALQAAIACSERSVGDEVGRILRFLLSDRSLRVKWNRVRNWAPEKLRRRR